MDSQSETISVTPPGLIASLTAGFNTVATHIYLILFPVALDILLWMGPHLRIKVLFEPVLQDYYRMAAEMNTPDTASIMKMVQQSWSFILDQFNMFGLLRTFPIGVTNLFSTLDSVPVKTPWGSAPTFEVKSFLSFLGLWLVLTLAGVMAGSLYFREIARKLAPEKKSSTLASILWEISQMVALNISFFVILFILLIPIGLVLLFMAQINSALAQIAGFFMLLFLIWILLPLIFSPHGVFALRQNVLVSMLTSVRLVRFFLPGTGLFFLVSLLISMGLDRIWLIEPAKASWMSLIGVLGHGFITTALISASFAYYLGGVRWMQASLNRPKPADSPTRSKRI
jgi:hypothetical protein